jgi:hypothetical protein
MQCRRHICNYLKFWRFHYHSWSSWSHNSKTSYLTLCWSLGGKWYNVRDLQCREGGTLPWVVQVEGNESMLVGIIVGIDKL